MINLLKKKIKSIIKNLVLGIVNNVPKYTIQGNVVMGEKVGIMENALLGVQEGGLLSLGNNTYIGRNVEIGVIKAIDIGDYTSIQDRCILLGDIDIQRYCLFAPNVYVSSGKHYFDLVPYWNIKDQDEYVAQTPSLSAKHSKKITIEEDCWIGINAVILRGVRVAKGTIVAANSVVNKDTFPYTVVGGAPAKVISKRLEFVPPKEIKASEEKDLPYFYNGFITRKIEREINQKTENGIFAINKFSVVLENSTQIYIRIKIMSHSEGILYYNDQQIIITDTYQMYILEANTTTMHEFLVTQKLATQKSEEKVIIAIEKVSTNIF